MYRAQAVTTDVERVADLDVRLDIKAVNSQVGVVVVDDHVLAAGETCVNIVLVDSS